MRSTSSFCQRSRGSTSQSDDAAAAAVTIDQILWNETPKLQAGNWTKCRHSPRVTSKSSSGQGGRLHVTSKWGSGRDLSWLNLGCLGRSQPALPTPSILRSTTDGYWKTLAKTQVSSNEAKCVQNIWRDDKLHAGIFSFFLHESAFCEKNENYLKRLLHVYLYNPFKSPRTER